MSWFKIFILCFIFVEIGIIWSMVDKERATYGSGTALFATIIHGLIISGILKYMN